MNEGIAGLERFISETSPARVLFGSHYPFFYFESAFLKVRSAGLPPEVELALFDRNARSLLEKR
jgi:predicted TIM-barrel fold metal-dependent hydrolase